MPSRVSLLDALPTPLFVPSALDVPPASLNSLPAQTGYNILMRSCAFTTLARITALAVALCLLIAPLCSARCSLSSCLPTTAPEQASSGCHHHAVIPHDASTIAGDRASSCQTADSLFDAIPSQFSRLLTPVDTSTTPSQFVFLAAQSSTSMVATDSLALAERDSSPGISRSAFSNSSLRL